MNTLPNRPEVFTEKGIVDFILANDLRMLNFMYPAEDGRIKTLNFTISDTEYLSTILRFGERVDGSSLFPSFVDAVNSDLYVLPRYNTAFVDPFEEIPTLDMLCCLYDKNGKPFECDPHRTVLSASQTFRERTGMEFEAMGELEYYVISQENPLFPTEKQKGYHESAPFSKHGSFRMECMAYISRVGGKIKYGHSEVGNFSLDGKTYEQNEIEFLPCPIETAADQLLLAKWVIRSLGLRYGLDVTFAPKIIVGEAGSGLHIHIRILKDGVSLMTEDNGELSSVALRSIAGMLELAPAITAFGNKNPASYFRLVPQQEAPTNICWGDCNRSALIRVPLGWANGAEDMCKEVNGKAAEEEICRKENNTPYRQTVEMRSPDSSADVYQLMAGLCVACRYGLEMPEKKALEIIKKNYAGSDALTKGSKDFRELPSCCAESAKCLEESRAVFEENGVFSERMTGGIISTLRKFNDSSLLSRAKKDKSLMEELVKRFFYCG